MSMITTAMTILKGVSHTTMDLMVIVTTVEDTMMGTSMVLWARRTTSSLFIPSSLVSAASTLRPRYLFTKAVFEPTYSGQKGSTHDLSVRFWCFHVSVELFSDYAHKQFSSQISEQRYHTLRWTINQEMREMRFHQSSESVTLQHLRQMHLQIGPSLYLDSDLHWILQPASILLVYLLYDHRSAPVLVLDDKVSCHSFWKLSLFWYLWAWSLHFVGNYLCFCWVGRPHDCFSLCWTYTNGIN